MVARVMLALALALVPGLALAQGGFIDPSQFGDALWQGEVATEDALEDCDGDSASTIHWVVAYDGGGGALAHCPADGSDWTYYEFGGGGGGGSSAFADLTSGTNTTAAMVVGMGASLATSGSGTIAATTAAALAANGANCSAGNAPLGVDAAGAVEGCYDVATQAEVDALDLTEDDLSDNTASDLSDVSGLSGNGTVLVTTTGTQTSGDCVSIDANGNHVASGAACGGGSSSAGASGAVQASDGAGGFSDSGVTASSGDLTTGDDLFVGDDVSLTSAAARLNVSTATSDGTIDLGSGATIGGGSSSASITLTSLTMRGTASSDSFRIYNRAATATAPIYAFNADSDTGFGADAGGTGGVVLIDEGTTLLLATTTGDDYVSINGCKHFGKLTAAPAVTSPSECDMYVDTDDGSGNAALCVYLDGAWVKAGGAGACP